tara:strand:- start:102 stop:494 length:393 start_codon:yes stop_codon:yes gene_type:complete
MSFISKFLKTLLSNFTSRRFIVAASAFVVERWDYWDNIVAIYTFTAPGEAQLQAFIALNQQHRYLLGAIVLFYIGLQTVSNSSFTAASTLQNLVSSASSFSKAESKHTEVIIDESAKNENLRHHKDGDDE